MGFSLVHRKDAVEAGYWHLYRYDPRRKEEGKNPFMLDSRPPAGDLNAFMDSEHRYAALKLTDPDRAEQLYAKAVRDARERLDNYLRLERA
jgi:pyruvate-ferredoxin/flavodoxin oxidoreductase